MAAIDSKPALAGLQFMRQASLGYQHLVVRRNPMGGECNELA